MAEQAQKEPTMEEILSSIRKIIADEEPAPRAEPTEAVSPEVTASDDDDAFDDLDLTFDDFTEESAENEDDILEALTDDDSDVFEAAVDEPAEAAAPVEVAAEETEDAFEAFDDFEDEFVDEVVAEAQPDIEDEPIVPEPDLSEPEAVTTEEARPMPSAALADPSTVGAAAGALSKLLSKVEFGDDGDNSMEALVRELLRPMLKDWLDANLPGIVEQQVEAEVKRIARMAG